MAKYRWSVQVSVEIPVNTAAEMILPVPKNGKVTESGIPISTGKLFEIEQLEDKVKIKTGSGSYRFEVKR